MKNLTAISLFIGLSLAASPALAKKHAKKEEAKVARHCMKDGAETGATSKKVCKSEGGKWTKVVAKADTHAEPKAEAHASAATPAPAPVAAPSAAPAPAPAMAQASASPTVLP